jgi:hypothetical protein
MHKIMFVLAVAAAFVFGGVVIASASPVIVASARSLHAAMPIGFEKIEYYFWGYHRPLYTFTPLRRRGALGAIAYLPPAASGYPPPWPNDYLPPYGYLDYYQTYGCLTSTQYCIFGQLPY